MRDGYYQLVNIPQGFGLKLVRPADGGAPIKGIELTAYLDKAGISYDMAQLRKHLEGDEDTVMELGEGPCPPVDETYSLKVSQDRMMAAIYFQPPSDSGKRVQIQEVLGDLRVKNIVHGIDMPSLSKHFQSEGCYGEPVIAAKGTAARQGHDASIEYYFNTNPTARPTLLEDGSVDYFKLDMINHCKMGDVLARLTPADPGEDGQDIFGGRVKPREVRSLMLKYGTQIKLSDDGLTISSMVDGHVMLVDGKVFVSNVYQVENVDLSTGNIDFVGSVQVNGNVKENMRISAGGNVVINGVVEGAHIKAQGNIIIARGMNGMTKGTLEAGGNVICKFLENTNVKAGGYVNTESILYSDVAAGTEIIVTGRKGFITGGHVQAGKLISVRNLGANMGNTTVVEVGIDPETKAQYNQLQREVGEVVKAIRTAQPVIQNFAEKKAKGARFTQEQLKYVAEMNQLIKDKTVILNEKNALLKALTEKIANQKDARVEVNGVACSGTTIIIGEVSTILKDEYRYCRFEKVEGQVKMQPL